MSDVHQDEDGFDKWLQTKDRLERGLHILSNLEGTPIVKKQLHKVMLAVLATDYSIGLHDEAKRTTKKSMMKNALRNWMIKHYSFESLHVTQQDYDRFSPAMQDMIPKEEGNLILSSCTYTKCNADEDEKVANSLFLREFNRQWEEAKSRLHHKCEDDLRSIAEPKTSAMQLSDNKEYYPYSDMHQFECKVKESKDVELKGVQTKSTGVAPSSEPLTPEAYGVSKRRFQNHLSFGIRSLIQLEKDIKKEKVANAAAEKVEKQVEAKRAHDQWDEMKYRMEAEARKKANETLEAQLNRKMEQEKIFGKQTASLNKPKERKIRRVSAI